MSEARNAILNRVKNVALGNSDRGFKEVASDLLCEIGKDNIKQISEGTYLSRATVARVMDCEDNYRPQSETLERIFKYCNAKVTFDQVSIRGQFQNKPKD